MDETLIQRLRDLAGDHFQGHGILAAYAHGSRVSGRPLPDSDLDVGYYLDGYARGSSLPVAIEMSLAGSLSDTLGVEVDLRNLADAPLDLRGHVLEEGVRIFSGDPVARVALERDLLSHYHDYKNELREMHEIRLKRIADRGF